MDRRKILLAILYWAAVLVVSVAILVGLILLLESRDSSNVDGGTIIAIPSAVKGSAP